MTMSTRLRFLMSMVVLVLLNRVRKCGHPAAGKERQQAPGVLPAPSAWGQQACPFSANAPGKRGPGSSRRGTWLAVRRGRQTQALAAWSGIDILIEPDGESLTVLPQAFSRSGCHDVWSGADVAHYTASTESCAAVHWRNDWHGARPFVGTQVGGGTSDFALHGAALFRWVAVPDVCATWNPATLGMRTAGLLVFGISPQSNIRTDADAIRFHNGLLERIRALPGVDSATIMPGAHWERRERQRRRACGWA